MSQLYPIIRRKRRPLLPMDSPAGGGQTVMGQGIAGGGVETPPPGLPSEVKEQQTAAPPPGEAVSDSES